MPAPLFVRPPTIDPAEYLGADEARKVASIRLTSPPAYWADEITQALLRDHPYVPAERVVVTFKRKDEAGGNALGYIGITGSPTLTIPVIVVNRTLKPLDIMVQRSTGDTGSEEAVGDMTDDRVQPLTEEAFMQAMDTGSVGDPVFQHEIRGAGWSEDGSSMRLPYRGRTVLASVMGATDAQKDAFAQVLSDKQILAGFLSPCPMPSGAIPDLGVKLSMRHEMAKQDVLTAWLQAPAPRATLATKIAGAAAPVASALLADELPVACSPDDIAGAQVIFDTGEIKAAAVLPVVSLADPTKVAQLLICEDGTYTGATPSLAVLPSSADDHLLDKVAEALNTRSLQRDSIVSFQVHDGQGLRFTAPAKIASIQVSDATKSIAVTLLDGITPVRVTLTPAVKVATLTNEGWVLPSTSPVFRLAAPGPAPMSEDKVADHFRRALPDELVCAGGQYTLSIRGETFGVVQAPEAKCAEVLRTWFTNADELLARVKQAVVDDVGFVRFNSNLPGVVEDITKIATMLSTEWPERVGKIIADAGMPMEAAVKLAAAIGDPQGADAVLGAGFLTEDNLSEFVGLADEFENTVSRLARLLLAIRMGFPGDEAATTVAMKSLQRVTERLQSAAQELG